LQSFATKFATSLVSAGWTVFTLGADPGLDKLITSLVQSELTQPAKSTFLEFATAVGKDFLSEQPNLEDLEKIVMVAIHKSLADVCVCKDGCTDAQLSCTGRKPMQRKRAGFHFVDVTTPLKGGRCWKQFAFSHTSDWDSQQCVTNKLNAFWPSWIDCEIPVFDAPDRTCHCSPGFKQDWLKAEKIDSGGDWHGCEKCTFLEMHPDIITVSGSIDYQRMKEIAVAKKKLQQDFDAPDNDETNGRDRRRRRFFR